MRLNFQTLRSNGFLDKTGAALSLICAVHCLAMPLVISFLPLLGISFLAHEGSENVIIGISSVVAAISLLPDYFKKHRQIRTLILFISGICLVICADRIFDGNLPKKMIFVLLGAGLITSAHFINRRLCRNCAKCGDLHSHSSA